MQAVRFLLVGLVSTGVHVLVAVALIEGVAMPPAIANGIAFLVATVASYLMNTFWSFSSVPSRSNLFRFVTVALVGGLMSMTLSGFADFLGLQYGVGILTVVAVVPPISYLMHKYWTYS